MMNVPPPINTPYPYGANPYAARPLATSMPMGGVFPVGQQPGQTQQNNSSGDTYAAGTQPTNPPFTQQHQGACNSLEEACRHYMLDAMPDVLDYMPNATQMGTMWMRQIQDRAKIKQDEAEARALPRPGIDAAKTMAGNVLQGIGRFFV